MTTASTLTISALIPTYNRAGYVGRAIESCLMQTLAPQEIIVVDDGSTDGTAEVLATYGDKLTVVRQSNSGLSAARNAGIRVASGDYVAFLDDDDVWLPDKLACQKQALADAPGALVVSTDFGYVVEDGSESIPLAPRRPGQSSILAALLMGDWLSPSTVMVHREALLDVGLFDPYLPPCDDWEMWLRLAQRYAWVEVPQTLALALWHRGNMSKNAPRMAQATWRVLDKFFNSPGGRQVGHRFRRHVYSAAHYRMAMSYLASRSYGHVVAEVALGLAVAPERVLLEPGRILFLGRSLLGRGFARAQSEAHDGSK